MYKNLTWFTGSGSPTAAHQSLDLVIIIADEVFKTKEASIKWSAVHTIEFEILQALDSDLSTLWGSFAKAIEGLVYLDPILIRILFYSNLQMYFFSGSSWAQPTYLLLWRALLFSLLKSVDIGRTLFTKNRKDSEISCILFPSTYLLKKSRISYFACWDSFSSSNRHYPTLTILRI